MKILFALLFSVSMITACASSNPNQGRWQHYAGCNESQCRSWESACEADCLNAGTNSQQCINQCGVKKDKCLEECK